MDAIMVRGRTLALYLRLNIVGRVAGHRRIEKSPYQVEHESLLQLLQRHELVLLCIR